MTGNPKNHDDALREALLAGDPAAGDDALTAGEQTAIRDRLAHPPARVPAVAFRAWWWRPVFAGGLLVALLVVLWSRPAHQPLPSRATVTPRERLTLRPPPAASASPVEAPAVAGRESAAREASARAAVPLLTPDSQEAPARTVRMITRGGTQIVWSVNPGARF
jgi:hypothetical protein